MSMDIGRGFSKESVQNVPKQFGLSYVYTCGIARGFWVSGGVTCVYYAQCAGVMGLGGRLFVDFLRWAGDLRLGSAMCMLLAVGGF